jgi:hypothetical protein
MMSQLQAAPEKIILTRLKPEELTDPQSRLLCDGHLFPLAIHNTPAGEYDVPVYCMTICNNSEKAA